MPGVRGAGGPPPKRSDQRRRKNTPAAGEPTKGEGKPAVQPPAVDGWHSVAKLWYQSLGESGQAAHYQASDWGLAYVLAESISRELNPKPVIDKEGNVEMVSMPVLGATLSAFLKGCTGLMVAEGDRRRAALELTVPKSSGTGDKPAGVTDIRSWREGLGA